MSNNMIKGYSVSYEKEVFKKLDFTDRENDLLEKAKEIYREQHDGDDSGFENDGFIAGLEVETLPDFTDEDSVEEIHGISNANGINVEEYKAQIRNEVYEEVKSEIEAAIREEMKDASEEIISNAISQAESIKAKALEEGRSEGEAAKAGIISLASAQGYEDGLRRAKDEEAEKIQALDNEKIQLENEYARQVNEMEPAFVEILKDYVKKITGIAYDNHTSVVSYLIDCGISKAPKETDFQVNLSSEDYERIQPEFDNICSKYSGKLTLNFKLDVELKPGEIQLENNGRILDCSLGVIMEGLLDALDMLSA